MLYLVQRSCTVPESVEMELHLQHGSQRRSRGGPQSAVELAQYYDLPETQEAVGGLARFDCGLDHCGHEPGIARFPPVGRYD